VSVIGITGYARHGKDTAGGVLVREYGYERIALADAVKEAVLALDPYIPDERMYASEEPDDHMIRLSQYIAEVGPEQAKKNYEVRRLYQVMGTEVGRDLLGESTWTDVVRRKIEANPGTDYVITDVRFPNEADMIGELQGELWRVVRLDEDGSVFDNGLGVGHRSEAYIAQLEYDCLITAREIEDVAVAVRGLME